MHTSPPWLLIIKEPKKTKPWIVPFLRAGSKMHHVTFFSLVLLPFSQKAGFPWLAFIKHTEAQVGRSLPEQNVANSCRPVARMDSQLMSRIEISSWNAIVPSAIHFLFSYLVLHVIGNECRCLFII